MTIRSTTLRTGIVLAVVCLAACQSALTKGKLYMRDGNDDEALSYLEQARIERPDDPEIRFLIGTVYARRGEYVSMNQAFEQSLELGDDHYLGVVRERNDYFTTEYNRGVSLLKNAADYPAAVQAFSQTTVIDPGQPAGWRNLGYTYFKLDSLAAATTAYEGARRADPEDPVSWFDLGSAQLANERHAAATASFVRLLELSPRHWDGMRSLALAHEGAGDTGAAIEVYERLLQALPDDQAAYYNLGNLHWRQEAYDKAIVAYEAALTLDPHDEDAMHNLALSYIVKEDLTKALPLLRQLVERMPENSMLWRELGRIHLLRGELVESEKAFARETALSPQ